MKSKIFPKPSEIESVLRIAYPDVYDDVGEGGVLEWTHGMYEHKVDDIVRISFDNCRITMTREEALQFRDLLSEAIEIERKEENYKRITVENGEVESWTGTLPDRRNYKTDEEYKEHLSYIQKMKNISSSHPF